MRILKRREGRSFWVPNLVCWKDGRKREERTFLRGVVSSIIPMLALLLLLNSEVVNNHVQSPVKLTNVTHPFIYQGRAYLTRAFAIHCSIPSSN